MLVNDVICVCVSGENVECVNRMDYLGHTITNDRSDSLVGAVSKYFNIKFNYVISDFGKNHTDVKNNLFFKYCISYYGSNMCSFYYVRRMERINIDWR